MMALKATSATTGRTKNQALWLTVFLISPSRHQPAVFVDPGMPGVEAEIGLSLRDRRAFGDEQLDQPSGRHCLDDAVATGIEHLDDVDRDAAAVAEGNELRPDAELEAL